MKYFVKMFLTIFISLLLGNLLYAQWCVPATAIPYSANMPGITNFQCNTINRTSLAIENYPGNSYVNTGQSTVLIMGNTYNVSITHTKDAVIFPNVRNNIRIWIDYNLNYTFDDAGETVVSLDLQPAGTTTANFTVPTNINIGTTRMRVTAKMSSDGGHILPSPCDIPADPYGYHGEIEDYTVGVLVPVELSSFQATFREDHKVILEWHTESETSNHGFEVERGQGETFERIGFVQGNGTTTSGSDYRFIDQSPPVGNSDGVILYRLKQIDTDGSSAYSNIVAVQLLPLTVSLFQNYPNPAYVGSSTVIPYDMAVPGSVDLAVYNSLGQKIATLEQAVDRRAGHYEVSWDGKTDLGLIASSGVYFIRFTANLGNSKLYNETKQISTVR